MFISSGLLAVRATVANLASINPNTNPLVTYLFGEIKRGLDGNYYIPQLSKAADQIHAYTGAGFNPNFGALEKIRKLIKSEAPDLWDELNDEIKTEVDLAIKELDNGGGVINELAMKKYGKWLKK